MSKIKVLFSRTFEVEVEDDGVEDEMLERARAMVIDGHPDVVTGALEFDGYDDADEEE